MKHLFLFALLAVFSVTALPSFAQNSADKVAAIHTLMEKTHMHETEVATMTSMLQSIRERPDLKDVPTGLWDRFQGKFDSLSTVILDSAVEIYAKYYTLEDVNELIKIYDNPVMQKSIAVMPQMFTEISQLGGRLGRETMTELMQDESTTPAPADKPEKPHRQKGAHH